MNTDLGHRLAVRKVQAELRLSSEEKHSELLEQQLTTEGTEVATDLCQILRGDGSGLPLEIEQEANLIQIKFTGTHRPLVFEIGCRGRGVIVTEFWQETKIGSPLVIQRSKQMYFGDSGLQAVIVVEERIAQAMGW